MGACTAALTAAGGSRELPGLSSSDTRTPLTVWFAAVWYMTTAKNGVSARNFSRCSAWDSYQTAWAMLHRYRAAMSSGSGHDLLAGSVEVDETFVGGEHPGPGGRGALGKELVAVAVELHDPKGFGRVRIRVIPNADTPARPRTVDGRPPGLFTV